MKESQCKACGPKNPVGRPFLVKGQATIPYGFRVPEGLLGEFKAKACERGVPVSEAMRLGMRLWLDQFAETDSSA